MNLKDFEYIMEIARQESISKAAARLYLSQPTLTKFLKRVEGEFETRLFDRVGKKMILTEAGKCCVEKAEQILELNDQMNKNIQYIRQSNKGMVRIGTSASRGEFFISRVLPKMKQICPQIHFSLMVEAKRDLQKKLEENEVDIIFVSNYAERPYLDYVRIAQEEMVLVVPNGHELIQKSEVRENFSYPYVGIEDWIQYPFVAAQRRMTTGQYTALLFEHYERKPEIVLEVNSMQLIYSAVCQEIGISITPSMPCIPREHQKLRYLSFEDEQNIQWYFTAITNSGRAMYPEVKELISIVQKEYKASSGKQADEAR